MKTLTKIKLINWQGFFDETIPVKGAVLVTGENGCGKSSLLDAFYFLLTGGDTDRFNSAANDRTDRTLETYMLGTTGQIGNANLRKEGNIVSHIALEFLDDSTKQHFIVGAVCEMQEGKTKPGRTFYHLKNTVITEDLFHSEIDGTEVILNFKAMQKKLGKDILRDLGSTRTEIRRALYSILSVEGGKFYELLPKALSFKPIDDVDDFVYKFLMPEMNVNIRSVQENIKDYNETQRIVRNDKAKLEILNNISEKGKEYKNLCLDQKLMNAYFLKSETDKAEEDCSKYRKTIDEEVRIQKRLNEDIKSLTQTIDDLKETVYSIKHKEEYQHVMQVQNQIKGKLSECRDLKSRVENYNKLLISEKSIALELSIPNHFTSYLEKSDFIGLQTELKTYQSKIKEIEKEKSIRQLEVYRESEKLKREKDDLIKKRDKLKDGIKQYPEAVQTMIDIIQKGLNAEFGVHVKAIPFCELIDIQEGQSEWRNALEGYLSAKRFDLFIPEEYFDAALALYEKYKEEKRIFGVGLIDIEKIRKQQSIPQENSLYHKLQCVNQNASLYAQSLLNDIICVDSENDLRKFDSSITKEVMVYENKAVRQTKPTIYKDPFIGRDSIRIQLESVENSLKDIDEKIKTLDIEGKQINDVLNCIGNSKYISLINSEDIWSMYQRAQSELKNLQFQLEELNEASGNLLAQPQAIERQIEDQEEKLKALDEKVKESVRNQQKATDGYDSCLSKQNETSTLLSKALKDEETASYFDDFFRSNHFSIQEIQSRKTSDTLRIEKYKRDIEGQMQSYIQNFNFDATSTIDSLEDFNQEMNSVVSRDLMKYENQLELVRQKAIVTFQNSYIAEIRKHIEDQVENIRELNRILAEKPFGESGDVYHFEISRSKDPAFGDYYDIFRSNQDYSMKDLFTDQLTDKNQELMNELFQRLTTENTDEKTLKLIRDFTDYRKFMSYDIRIKDKDGGQYYFSKISKSKSGGETQTPFYVIIAASFDQIIRTDYGNASKGCLVLFDEAFEKMDEAHVDSMMQFFRQLSIQPIIAVPSRNAKPIIPYVDTTIGLVKIKGRIHPRLLVRSSHESIS